MRTLVLLALLANLIVTAALPAQQIHPDEIKLKPRIDQAIGAGVEPCLMLSSATVLGESPAITLAARPHSVRTRY